MEMEMDCLCLYACIYVFDLLRNYGWLGAESGHGYSLGSGTWYYLFSTVKLAVLLQKTEKIFQKEKEEEKGERGKASNFLL